MSDDPLEIIITTGEEPTPQKVGFEALYPVKDDITSIVFLWNTNSYFIDIENNMFMLNGGRRISFPDMGRCHLLYRKRNAVNFAVGSLQATSKKTVTWIVGLENEDEKKIVLMLRDNGKTWQWANEL